MRRAAALSLAAAILALAPASEAKLRYFVGHADDDTATTIQFTASGSFKKTKQGRRKFVPKQVRSICVYNQFFICFAANGAPTSLTGYETYLGYALIDPLEVTRKGRFGGFYENVYQSPYGGDPITLELVRFRGRIKGTKATGTYQTQASEGGIELGYCGDRDPVEWTAKRQRKPPGSPPEG